MRIIISGGGSGGHVFPAIAIANALKRKRPDVELLFVGANGKIEMEKVPKAGYKIEGLDVVGFHRKRMWRNIGFPLKLFKSMRKAKKIIERFGPDVVVGVGGFASGPVLKQAQRRGIATLIQEQNSYPGVTNKLLAKNARKICVAYDKMDRFFPKEKLVLTGNPVRMDLVLDEQDLPAAYNYYKINSDKRTTLIIGGSLGARSLNEAIKNSFAFLEERSDIQFIWQVGKLYYDEYKSCRSANLPNVHVHAFIDRMDFAYGVADVLICRAGALTIAELAMLQKAAVLVPSPNVSEDHQTKNAMALVDKEAAVLLKDDALEGWEELVVSVLDDAERQKTLKKNIVAFGKPNAADNIADIILDLV